MVSKMWENADSTSFLERPVFSATLEISSFLFIRISPYSSWAMEKPLMLPSLRDEHQRFVSKQPLYRSSREKQKKKIAKSPKVSQPSFFTGAFFPENTD